MSIFMLPVQGVHEADLLETLPLGRQFSNKSESTVTDHRYFPATAPSRRRSYLHVPDPIHAKIFLPQTRQKTARLHGSAKQV